MTTLEIFEKINLITPVEQRRFFNWLEDSISELKLILGNKIFYSGYERLLSAPNDWNEKYNEYFELSSNGFMPVRSNDFKENKCYKETEKEDPLINIPPPKHLNDDIVVKSLFHICLIDNILYLAGLGDKYKNEFLRKASLAEREDWNANNKGGRIRRMRW